MSTIIPCNVLRKQNEELTSIHPIGTAAVVVQVTGTNWPQPAYTLLATGLCRFKIDDVLQETPYPIARVTQLDKLEDSGMILSNIPFRNFMYIYHYLHRTN